MRKQRGPGKALGVISAKDVLKFYFEVWWIPPHRSSRLSGSRVLWIPSLCFWRQKQHTSHWRSAAGTCHEEYFPCGQRFRKHLRHILCIHPAFCCFSLFACHASRMESKSFRDRPRESLVATIMCSLGITLGVRYASRFDAASPARVIYGLVVQPT